MFWREILDNDGAFININYGLLIKNMEKCSGMGAFFDRSSLVIINLRDFTAICFVWLGKLWSITNKLEWIKYCCLPRSYGTLEYPGVHWSVYPLENVW